MRGKFVSNYATGEDVKSHYIAIKFHFTNKNYDIKKYKGKFKDNFRDLPIYDKIAKGKLKEDLSIFFVPAMFINPNVDLDYFQTEDYNDVWRYWKGYNETPNYFFKRECSDILDILTKKSLGRDSLFQVKPKQLPMIYKLIVQDKISPMTLLHMDSVLGFHKAVSSQVDEKILFPKLKMRLDKIKTFIQADIDNEAFSRIVKETFF